VGSSELRRAGVRLILLISRRDARRRPFDPFDELRAGKLRVKAWQEEKDREDRYAQGPSRWRETLGKSEKKRVRFDRIHRIIRIILF
jgi:hypothetical protein